MPCLFSFSFSPSRCAKARRAMVALVLAAAAMGLLALGPAAAQAPGGTVERPSEANQFDGGFTGMGDWRDGRATHYGEDVCSGTLAACVCGRHATRIMVCESRALECSIARIH